jgi:hypothetical protein
MIRDGAEPPRLAPDGCAQLLVVLLLVVLLWCCVAVAGQGSKKLHGLEELNNGSQVLGGPAIVSACARDWLTSPPRQE